MNAALTNYLPLLLHFVFTTLTTSYLVAACICCKKRNKGRKKRKKKGTSRKKKSQSSTEFERKKNRFRTRKTNKKDDYYYHREKGEKVTRSKFADERDPDYDTLLLMESEWSKSLKKIDSSGQVLTPRTITPKTQQEMEKIERIKEGQTVEKKDPRYKTLRSILSDWGDTPSNRKRIKRDRLKKKLEKRRAKQREKMQLDEADLQKRDQKEEAEQPRPSKQKKSEYLD